VRDAHGLKSEAPGPVLDALREGTAVHVTRS
jgi:hypothetical protein